MAEEGQQNIQNLALQHRELQKRAQTIQQQTNMLQMSIDDCGRAITTLEDLQSFSKNPDTLVPIGAGSFVNAHIANDNKVVVEVGAGISVEKDVDGAKITLNKRKEDLQKVLEQMNQNLEQINQRIQSIESMAKQQQQQPQQ